MGTPQQFESDFLAAEIEGSGAGYQFRGSREFPARLRVKLDDPRDAGREGVIAAGMVAMYGSDDYGTDGLRVRFAIALIRPRLAAGSACASAFRTPAGVMTLRLVVMKRSAPGWKSSYM